MGTQANRDDIMPAESDFSKGTRGKFSKASAMLKLPIYLDSDVDACLLARVEARGIDIDQLLYKLLKKDIEFTEVSS